MVGIARRCGTCVLIDAAKCYAGSEFSPPELFNGPRVLGKPLKSTNRGSRFTASVMTLRQLLARSEDPTDAYHFYPRRCRLRSTSRVRGSWAVMHYPGPPKDLEQNRSNCRTSLESGWCSQRWKRSVLLRPIRIHQTTSVS
jgi:hypothetical protein